MRRLPPLNSLRAFEAAARHLSFTKASEELFVTPGAVSQQIKALEDYLGAPVFKRDNRNLILTPAAEGALTLMRDGFDKLAVASNMLVEKENQSKLTISVAPSFASKWLVPRLEDFQLKHPDIDVYVHAHMEVIHFAREDVDLAIRYGPGHYPDLTSAKILEEKIIPVCAPSLLTGEHALRDVDDIRHHTLLHDDCPGCDDDSPNWAMWLRAAGVYDVDATRGPRFNQSSLVVEAAVAGRGIALAKSALALADLEAARLTVPFDLTTHTDFAYYIVHPPVKDELPQVKIFKEWLLETAAKEKP